jgi:hypothetical protein
MIMLSDKSDFSYEMDDKKINHNIKKGLQIINPRDHFPNHYSLSNTGWSGCNFGRTT